MHAALLVFSLQSSPEAPCESAWRAALGLEGRTAADSIAVADSLAAEPGDCDRAVAAYLRAFSPLYGEEHWRERLAVEQDLNEAIRRFGTEPRFMLALGHLRYQQSVRVDARRSLERALDRAAEAVPPVTPRERAVAAYLLGRMAQDDWRDWRSFGQLRGMSRGQWSCPAYSLEPGRAYNVAVEMHDRERRVLGQARDTLTALTSDGRPGLSDVLLVREVSAGGVVSRSRSELRVQHLSGRTVPEGSGVGLVWEVYDVAPDSAGRWRYRVRLEVKDAEGRSLLTRILRGGRPDRPATTLEYDRTVEAAGDRTVEWVNLSSEWKPGRYELVLRLQDLVTGSTAIGTTGLVVEAPPPNSPRR